MYTESFGAPSYFLYSNGKNAPAVHVTDTALSRFFQRYLLQKAMSVFEWSLPETWDKDYFLYTLYCWGYLSVINTDRFGVIPQACTLAGFDVYYRPTNAFIANPLLQGIKSPRIGVQCEIVKLQPDYGNIMDLVCFHADMMALSAQTAGVNLVNSKLSYVFGASNKAAATSFKTMYDEIASGKPAVVIDKALFGDNGKPEWSAFMQNVGQNYIAGQILDDMRKWEQRFDTAIGIPNANTEKKERLIVDEVNANNAETRSLCDLWLDTLQIGCKKVNAMFDTNISVKWRIGEVKNNVSNTKTNV